MIRTKSTSFLMSALNKVKADGMANRVNHFCFNRPASRNALAMIHSSWPLVLLNSSAAHFSTAFSNSASTRRANGFFWAISVLVSLYHFFKGCKELFGPLGAQEDPVASVQCKFHTLAAFN